MARDGRVDVIAKLRGATAASVRRLALGTLDRLVDATPVDTGHARSNWVLSVGTPFTGVDGSKDAVSEAAQDAGRAAVSKYRLSQGPVLLSNNVEYLAILNEGSSTQAPAGFVESAIEAAQAAERVILDLEKAARGNSR